MTKILKIDGSEGIKTRFFKSRIAADNYCKKNNTEIVYFRSGEYYCLIK